MRGLTGGLRRWAWIWLPLVFLVTVMGWALTSPVGSSPDDDYHLSSIWCAQGIQEGRCEEVPGDPSLRAVPAAVVQASDCYRFDAAITADCAATLPGTDVLVTTDRVNAVQGLYPGGFYSVMSVLVLDDVERSVTAMRLLNALLATVLLAAVLRLLPAGLSAAAVLAVTVTFVPLGLSLVASTNPSSWAIIGIGTYWALALGLLRRRTWADRRGILITVGTVIAGLMTVASRVDASAYVVVASIVALTLAGWRRALAVPGRLAVIGALSVLAVLTYVGRGEVVAGGTGMGSAEPGAGLLLTNLAYLPVLIQGAVGGWALGWNDTILPPFVPVAGTLVLGALAYRGLARASRRQLVASGLALAALVAVPIGFLQANGLGVGEVVQPRYLLPLLTLLVGVLALGPRLGVPLALPVLPAWVIGAGLSVSALLAFWANAHRYFAGNTVGLFDPKVSPAWIGWPGVPVWLVAAVVAVSTVALVAGSVMLSVRPQAGTRATASNWL
jgi:hypothetical protein